MGVPVPWAWRHLGRATRTERRTGAIETDERNEPRGRASAPAPVPHGRSGPCVCMCLGPGAPWAVRDGHEPFPPAERDARAAKRDDGSSIGRVKLLLVSLYFPPAGGGGVQRPLKFAQYLPALGI